MGFEQEFERANRRAGEMQAGVPLAVSARFDRHRGRVFIELNSGLEIGFLPNNAEGLENASPEDLQKIEISPSGFGLYFPTLDADLYVPALLEGVFGSRKWMAARLGQVGGFSRSRGKAAASRKNGKLGGRPRLGTATKVK